MEASTSVNHKSICNTSTTEDTALMEESLDFSSPWHFSDVVLIVEDTKFHVHKSTLSMWSPVFKVMFTSQFIESNAKEIPLPGKRVEEVKELLHVIYSSWSKPNVTEENCQFLLQLADEYQMDRVKKLCSEFLVNKIEVSNCLEFLKLAEQFGLDDVKKKCDQEVPYSSSADLEGSEHFNGFEPELKVDICMRVIKELERTLQEYVTTCSDLVQKVYRKVSLKINGGIVGESITLKEHIKRHKSQLTKVPMKRMSTSIIDAHYDSSVDFQFSCPCCIEEVKQTQWNFNDNYSILKEPLRKSYVLLLQHMYRSRSQFIRRNKRK